MTIPAEHDTPVTCPKCQSAQVHAGQRGWNAATGFLGSGGVRITCLKCGHQFKPGETTYTAPVSNVPALITLLVIVVLGVLLYLSS